MTIAIATFVPWTGQLTFTLEPGIPIGIGASHPPVEAPRRSLASGSLPADISSSPQPGSTQPAADLKET